MGIFMPEYQLAELYRSFINLHRPFLNDETN
jgi:hypothetical protein